MNFSSENCRRVKRGDAPRPWHDGLLVASAVGVALFVLYIRTLHPSVPGGDSGKFREDIYSGCGIFQIFFARSFRSQFKSYFPGELIVSAHELGVSSKGRSIALLCDNLTFSSMFFWEIQLKICLLSTGCPSAGISTFYLAVQVGHDRCPFGKRGVESQCAECHAISCIWRSATTCSSAV